MSDAIDEAIHLLERLAEATTGNGYRDNAMTVRARIARVSKLLNPRDPLHESDLEDLRSVWTWLLRQEAILEYWMPANPPSRDVRDLILDSRPDLAPHEGVFAEESIDAWVSVAHGHDGHLFYFWDTSDGTRIVALDNSWPDVFHRDYPSLEDYLVREVFPSMIRWARRDLDDG